METKEVRHVDVWSAAKLCAAINLVITVIIGIIGAVLALLNLSVAETFSGLTGVGTGIVGLIISIVILAVIGMIIGFIVGAIVAVIYNLAAGVFGGLKVELE